METRMGKMMQILVVYLVKIGELDGNKIEPLTCQNECFTVFNYTSVSIILINECFDRLV